MFKVDSGAFPCNRKFIRENFVEPHHVPVAHSVPAAGQPLRDHSPVGNGRVLSNHR